MKPALQLEEFAFTRLHLDFVEGDGEHNGNGIKTLGMVWDYDLAGHQDDPRRFRIRFRVEAAPSDGKGSGYKLATEIVGFFFSERPLTDETGGEFVVLGCALLYGALRGQVAMITGAGPLGRFTLPTVSMPDVIRGIHEGKQEAGGQKETPSKRGRQTRPAAKKSVAAKKDGRTETEKPRAKSPSKRKN